mgnify:FL=1
MFKKLLIFPVLILLTVFSLTKIFAEIIPLKKPLQTKEEKEQKLLIDVLKPLQKPRAKIE